MKYVKDWKRYINEQTGEDTSHLIVAIFGASGTGKTTLKKYFISQGWSEVKSTTTRPPRAEEESLSPEESEYRYITDIEDFGRTRAKGELFNVRNYKGHMYGTKIEEFMKPGKSVMMTDIDSIKELRQKVGLGIGNKMAGITKDIRFIHCVPDFETVKKALTARGAESAERIPGLSDEIEHLFTKVRQLKMLPEVRERLYEVVCIPEGLKTQSLPQEVIELEKTLSEQA